MINSGALYNTHRLQAIAHGGVGEVEFGNVFEQRLLQHKRERASQVFHLLWGHRHREIADPVRR
ncbi:MAG: Uncharacterised protein [Halieaceae bacterium]|nr:MAG: Uncharacterised protein [Halieaceae bacterium]